MNLQIEDFLDHVDQWKFKVHKKLKGLTLAQRKAFWDKIHTEARKRGLPVLEAKPKRPTKRSRRIG